MLNQKARMLRRHIKTLRLAMRENGVRRISVMNAGLSAVEYRCNLELSRLENELAKLKGETR